MAHPPGPALLAPLHARDRVRVAREHRQAQVGPERLGDRARRRPALGPVTGVCSSPPATGPRWSSSITSVRGAPASTARSSRARACVESGARRVLPARRDDRGARATREGASSAAGASRGRRSRPARARGRARAAGRTGRRSRGPRPPRCRPAAGALRARARCRRAPRSRRTAARRDSVGTQLLASSVSSPSAAGSPYRRTGGRGASARPRSGSSAGSGLPRERSRAPAGTGNERARGSARRPVPMRVARRGSVTTTPRRRSSASAAATVTGLRPTCERQPPDRRQPLPGRERPAATASSMFAPARLRSRPEFDTVSGQSYLYYDRSGDGRALPCPAARGRHPRPPPGRAGLRARAAAAQARARQLRPRVDRRDPRRGADRPPRHRRRGRPAVRDPHAARAPRRRRLLPRLGRAAGRCGRSPAGRRSA